MIDDPRLPDRFWAKVSPEPNSGCWLWTGVLSTGGYGQLMTGSMKDGTRGMRSAHRLAYSALVGPIPAGLQIDHLCRTRPCVNPAHLEPVTQAENIRRGEGGSHHRNKTHCHKGHPYDEANTYRISTRNARYCRACAKEYSRNRWATRGFARIGEVRS